MNRGEAWSNAGKNALANSGANCFGVFPDGRHALVAGSGGRAPASMLRKARQMEDVVEDGPMDAH